MAMKFVKNSIMPIMLTTFFILTGCSTQKKVIIEEKEPIAAFLAKKQAQKTKQQITKTKPVVTPVVVKILPTQQYLPKQMYGELGEKILYAAAPNPYLQQTGMISKVSVELFIQARRDFKAKRFDQAKKTLLKLTLSAPRLSGPRVLLAKIAEHNKDLDTALTQYQKAVLINPKNVNTYIGLAKVQRLKGQYKQAQNTYAKALQVWKDFPEAHVNLAVLYDLYMNNSDKAQQHMEAYQFLTQGKNKQVTQWLSELKQRTGISKSFIDIPPPLKTVVDTPVNVVPLSKTSSGEES